MIGIWEITCFLLARLDKKCKVQSAIDLEVTDSRLNDARIKHQLYSLYKNVLGSQNPLEIFFTKRSKYDWQDPVIG